MERRKDYRLPTNEPVVVTELGTFRGSPMGGMMRDMSGTGMLLKLPRAIACNTPIRVEASDLLLLADVARCLPEGDGYLVGIIIRHSLQNLQDLRNLNRALLGEGDPEAAETEGAEIENPAPSAETVLVPIIRE